MLKLFVLQEARINWFQSYHDLHSRAAYNLEQLLQQKGLAGPKCGGGRSYQMRVASWVEHGPLVADVVHHGEGVLRPDLDDVLQRDVLARL